MMFSLIDEKSGVAAVNIERRIIWRGVGLTESKKPNIKELGVKEL